MPGAAPAPWRSMRTMASGGQRARPRRSRANAPGPPSNGRVSMGRVGSASNRQAGGRPGAQMDAQRALGLVLLGERGAFRRATEHHRRGEPVAGRAVRQHLVAMDVPHQERVEAPRQVAAPDHVGAWPEGVVGGPDAGALHGLVQTQEPQVRPGVHRTASPPAAPGRAAPRRGARTGSRRSQSARPRTRRKRWPARERRGGSGGLQTAGRESGSARGCRAGGRRGRRVRQRGAAARGPARRRRRTRGCDGRGRPRG